MPFPSRHAPVFVLIAIGALSLAPAQQFVDTVPLPSVGAYGPMYLPPADVDGDGDVDLVACTAAGVRLFLNDGANRFGSGVLIDPLVGTRAGAVADLDGDGDADIVAFSPTTAGGSTTLHLLRNNGGTFTASIVHQPAVAVVEAQYVQPIDIDGDGDLDLFAGVGAGSVVSLDTVKIVLENDGSGNFTDVSATWIQPSVFPSSSTGVRVLDFDADGRPDLLLELNMKLLRNTGTQFVDETSLHMPAFAGAARAVVVGDIDGDADPDLLVLTQGQPPQLWMNFAGTFADVTPFLLAPLAPVEQAVFLDVDKDGDLDLYVRGGSPAVAQLVVNSGGGVLLTVQPATDFRDHPLSVGVHAYRIHCCDLEGDGDDDLVLAWESAGVLRGDGRGHLVDPWAATRLPGTTFLDADGDGDLDVLTTTGLAINDGFGAFTLVPFSGAVPNGTAVADFDGDGDDDVAGASAVYLSNGGGSFTAVPLPAAVPSPGSTFAFDFDADGNVDVLGLSLVFWAPRLFRNTGGGVMTLVQTFPLGPAGYADAADVDGDGDLDLVTSGGFGAGGGTTRIWLQSSPGAFTLGPSVQVIGRAVFARLAGAGAPFVVVGGPSPRVLQFASATLVDVSATVLPAGFTGTEIVAGDVDGDGDVDLVGDQLLRNDGTGVLTLEPLGLRMPSRALRDVDRDGSPDLIVEQNGIAHVCWNREHFVDVPLPAATGRPLRLDVSSMPGRASALEFAVVGAGLTRFTPGAPTPFGELRLGAIGLTLGLALAPVTGAGSVSLPIPANPAFVGMDLHFQALHIGPAGWQLGNLASTRIE